MELCRVGTMPAVARSSRGSGRPRGLPLSRARATCRGHDEETHGESPRRARWSTQSRAVGRTRLCGSPCASAARTSRSHLARAFPCFCFAIARARGKFHVVWQRPLDAAAFGTIQTVEMIILTGSMQDSPPHDMLTSITASVDAPPRPGKALRGSAGAWPASPPTGRRGPRHDPGRRARRCP